MSQSVFNASHSDVQCLPVELIDSVAKCLPGRDRVSLGATNHLLHDIVLNDPDSAMRRDLYASGYAPGSGTVSAATRLAARDDYICAVAASSFERTSGFVFDTPTRHVYTNEGVVVCLADGGQPGQRPTVTVTTLACPLRSVERCDRVWSSVPDVVVADDGRKVRANLAYVLVEPSYNLAVFIFLLHPDGPHWQPLIRVKACQLADGKPVPGFLDLPDGHNVAGTVMHLYRMGPQAISTNGRFVAISVIDADSEDVVESVLVVDLRTSTTVVSIDGHWCKQLSFVDEQHAALVVSDDTRLARLELVDISSLARLEKVQGRFQGHSVLAVLTIPFYLRWSTVHRFAASGYGMRTIIGSDSGVRHSSQGFHHQGATIVPDRTAHMQIQLQVAEDGAVDGVGRSFWLNIHIPFLLFDRTIRLARLSGDSGDVHSIVREWSDWARASHDVVITAGWRPVEGAFGSRSQEYPIGRRLLWQERNLRKVEAIVNSRQAQRKHMLPPYAWTDALYKSVPSRFMNVAAQLQAAGQALHSKPVAVACPMYHTDANQDWVICGDGVLVITYEPTMGFIWPRKRVSRIDALALTLPGP